jgi:hypothetical protein
VPGERPDNATVCEVTPAESETAEREPKDAVVPHSTWLVAEMSVVHVMTLEVAAGFADTPEMIGGDPGGGGGKGGVDVEPELSVVKLPAFESPPAISR